jgi:23S rRNA pseudouridine1911/1915/1917 synthase
MKIIEITKEKSGTRIDKFLVEEFFSSGLTRGDAIRNIKIANVLVNGKKVKPSYALKEKDLISLQLMVNSSQIISNPKININVIYEDKDIIVVDKTAGISVHPGSVEQADTLVNGLLAKFPEIESVHDQTGDSYLRPGIVHRLDKETSGVMVVARNSRSFEELKNLFKFRKVTKKYIALVYGKLAEKEGVIDKNIARAATYKKQVIAGRKTKTLIRSAITEYKVIREFDGYSLLEVMPKTGRMHQIRVHLFSIGHPVVGDKLYKIKRICNKNFNRHLLHAQSIRFQLFGEKYIFKCPIPKDFAEIMDNIDEKPIKS